METILALSLVTNIGANAAVKAASLAARNTDTAMARLGSGTRIGAARDDATGLGTASRLTRLKRGVLIKPCGTRLTLRRQWVSWSVNMQIWAIRSNGFAKLLCRAQMEPTQAQRSPI